jgi:hypothetical protein
MDWIGILGAVGTFGFGILSLYQWTALTALRKAIRAHTQSAFNNWWSIGTEMEQLRNAAKESTTDAVDCATVLMRCSAANSTSIAARQETINFAREYAGVVPRFEKAWSPEPIPEAQRILERVFRAISGGSPPK